MTVVEMNMMMEVGKQGPLDAFDISAMDVSILSEEQLSQSREVEVFLFDLQASNTENGSFQESTLPQNSRKLPESLCKNGAQFPQKTWELPCWSGA